MRTCNDAPVGYTDHPPVGQWQPWSGGVCPVHPLATVDYMMASGGRCRDDADQLDWEHSGDDWDIIAYCIVEEYKAPVERKARECWLLERAGVFYHVGQSASGSRLFREVIQ